MTQVVELEGLPTIMTPPPPPTTCICFFERKNKQTNIELDEVPTNLYFKGCRILSLICMLGKKKKSRKVRNIKHHGIGKLSYAPNV